MVARTSGGGNNPKPFSVSFLAHLSPMRKPLLLKFPNKFFSLHPVVHSQKLTYYFKAFMKTAM